MTTDQLEDTDQIEETGAQVGEDDSGADSSGETDGHTEVSGVQEEASDEAENEPTESVVQSESAADAEATPDVDGTDGDLVAEEEPVEEEETGRASFAEPTVPAPDAEGEEVDLEGDGPAWLEGLFERMELDVEAEFVDESDERVLVNLTGEDAEHLLGRGKMGPKALEAVETILSRVFAGHPRSNDIYLDVDGARQARTERLESVAEDLADRAVELSKKVTMSGLNSSERRVIHHKLREDGRVETESVGEGIFRRLRIEPHN